MMLKLDLIYFSWETEICDTDDNDVTLRGIFLNTSLSEKIKMSFL